MKNKVIKVGAVCKSKKHQCKITINKISRKQKTVEAVWFVKSDLQVDTLPFDDLIVLEEMGCC